MSNVTVVSLIGAVDNLHEPMPIANHRGTILGVVLALMAVSLLCNVARLYVRFFVIYAPGWDDYFLMLYMLSTIFGSTCMCLFPSRGLGSHFILIPPEQMLEYLKLFWLANASYIMSTTLIKLSLLSQYLRLYQTGPLRWACVGLATVVAMWGAAFTIIAWYPCHPLQRFWDPWKHPGVCWAYGASTRTDFVTTFEAHAGINMVLDLLIFVLPIPIYFKQDNPSRAKKGLIALFLMGSVVIFFSIWRLWTIIEHMATTYPTFDPSWYAPISLLLSTAEIDLASVCASAPVFWPMLCRNVEKIFVTYELKITVEDRVVDAFELHHTRPRTGGGGCDDDDDDEGKGLEPPGSHYRNSFIRDQVNPFGKDGWLDSPAGAKNGTGMARVIVRSESQDPNEARKKTDKLPRFLSRDPPPA